MSALQQSAFVNTRTGKRFHFCNPDAYQPNITDIANGLSMCCRFVGQCIEFYSVAQHSVYVSRLVPPEHAMAGLLHDAVEAFIGDMSGPLKSLIPEYKAIQRRLEGILLPKLGIPYPLPACVKAADMAMLRAEHDQIMSPDSDMSDSARSITPADVKIEPLLPAAAYKLFMRRYAELSAARNAAPRCALSA